MPGTRAATGPQAGTRGERGRSVPGGPWHPLQFEPSARAALSFNPVSIDEMRGYDRAVPMVADRPPRMAVRPRPDRSPRARGGRCHRGGCGGGETTDRDVPGARRHGRVMWASLPPPPAGSRERIHHGRSEEARAGGLPGDRRRQERARRPRARRRRRGRLQGRPRQRAGRDRPAAGARRGRRAGRRRHRSATSARSSRPGRTRRGAGAPTRPATPRSGRAT